MHALVESHSDSILQTCVPVLDRLDVGDYLAVDATLFARFADSGDLRLFVVVDQAFG